MSVKIDNTTTTTIGNAIVGTTTIGSSSILAASTAFVNNFVNNLGLALNQSISYAISGIKSVPYITFVAGTSAVSNTGLGKVNATTVDIFPSTQAGAALTINNYLQPMQSSLVPNSWSKPIVVAPAQNSATPYTRIQSGVIIANSTGVTVSFPTPFSGGCIPRVFMCSQTAGAANTSAFNVSNSGFTAYCAGGNTSCCYFALGF